MVKQGIAEMKPQLVYGIKIGKSFLWVDYNPKIHKYVGVVVRIKKVKR